MATRNTMRFRRPSHWTLAQMLERRSMSEPTKGCLLWLGGVTKDGYGRVKWQGRMVLTHRLAFIDRRGPIPDGLQVLHECDVPSCVNPDHLFLGTHDDNMADKARKGRAASAPGELRPTAKLTLADVAKIRESTLFQREIAAQHGISQQLVSRIRRGKIWKGAHRLGRLVRRD